MFSVISSAGWTLKANLRQLLDGYETSKNRLEAWLPQVPNRPIAKGATQPPVTLAPREDFYLSITINNHLAQGQNQLMSTVTNNLEAATIPDFANEVNDDARLQTNQHSTPVNVTPVSAAHQGLGEAVEGLRALFTELDKSYDRNRPIGKAMIMAKAVEAIEGKPSLKARLGEAIKEGTAATIEVAVHHPSTKSVLAALSKAL